MMMLFSIVDILDDELLVALALGLIIIFSFTIALIGSILNRREVNDVKEIGIKKQGYIVEAIKISTVKHRNNPRYYVCDLVVIVDDKKYLVNDFYWHKSPSVYELADYLVRNRKIMEKLNKEVIEGSSDGIPVDVYFKDDLYHVDLDSVKL